MRRLWVGLVVGVVGVGLIGCERGVTGSGQVGIAQGATAQSGAQAGGAQADGMTEEERARMIAELRAAYAAFNRGDIAAALEPMDERIEWSEPKEFPGGGVYHGREGARRYLTRSRAGLADGTSEPEEFIPVGDKIVVLVHARVRPKGSFAWQELRLADVYTIRDGKAVAMRAFADRGEAMAWARGQLGAR